MTIEEKVIEESNAYFERNKNAITDGDEASKSAHLVGEFIERYLTAYPGTIKNMLEIGCNYGYNLNYLSRLHGIECYGIEPSDKAIEYGNSRWNETNPKVHMTQGFSSKLPYEDNKFDVVLIGFSLYVTPREMMAATVAEANRVLKEGGFLIITEFDTPLPCKRVNKYNADMPVFKEDYAKRFFDMGYSLAEKISYSHAGDCFTPDIQERVSTQILYKEITENLYTLA